MPPEEKTGAALLEAGVGRELNEAEIAFGEAIGRLEAEHRPGGRSLSDIFGELFPGVGEDAILRLAAGVAERFNEVSVQVKAQGGDIEEGILAGICEAMSSGIQIGRATA